MTLKEKEWLNKNAAKGSARGRTGRPLSELQNIGAGDAERTEALVSTHTLPSVILVGKFADILSHANLNMNSKRNLIGILKDQ